MKNIDKNIVALGWVSFFTDMASSMITTILPLYIVYVLNEGVDKLGFVVAIATFVSYIFRVLFGYISDRFHIVKPFVVAGYAISAMTKPLLYFGNSWQSIAILRGVERVGKAIRSASKDSLISAYSPKKSGKSFGFHKMMDVGGEMSGAIISFLTLYYMGKNETIFKEIFAFSFIPGVLAVVIVVFFVKDVACNSKIKEFNLKDDYRLLPMLFIYFGVIFFMFSDSFFIVSAKSSFGMEYIPLLVILLYFVQTVLSYYLGIKIDEIGFYKMFLISTIFGLVSLVLLYFHQIIFGFILFGIFTVGSLNAIRSFISDNAKNRATIYGVLYGGMAIFSSLGAVTLGMIWQKYSDKYAILFSVCGIMLCLIVLSFYKKRSTYT